MNRKVREAAARARDGDVLLGLVCFGEMTFFNKKGFLWEVKWITNKS